MLSLVDDLLFWESEDTEATKKMEHFVVIRREMFLCVLCGKKIFIEA